MTIDDSLRQDLLSSASGTPKKAENVDPLDLDQLIVSSSKQVLLKKIEFQAAEKDVSFCLQNLRGKYEPLNPIKGRPNPAVAPVTGKGNMSMAESGNGKSDGIPKPKMVLFNPEKIRLDWQKCHRIGAGLINMGNTCFLNSTLQCLSYTPPLVNYLLNNQHKEQCQVIGFCMMCELHNHLVRVGQRHGDAIRPMVIINQLKHIAKHMHLGRQEDAHEFLRYVIEAMQKSSLYGYDKLEKFSKETSVVHQIFGGYYRSRVICSLCHAMSDTFDPFLDIGLDIKHVPSVNKALDRLIRPEMLDGDNKYKCARCKRQVTAQKKFTIHRSSNILTLCLKKFDFQRFGSGKLHKDISYPETLNIRPYMSDVKGPPVLYSLYAVLTHQGSSCNSGHYFCFVRAPNKMWYCMNDAHVSQASLHRVLNQDAYLLFYIRKIPGQGPKNGPKDGPKERISGPFSPTTIKPPHMANSHNGGLSTKMSEVSIPKHSPRPPQAMPKPALKPLTVSTGGQDNSGKGSHQNMPRRENAFQAPNRATPIAAKREKISFSIKSHGVAGTLHSLQREQHLKTEPSHNKGVVDKGKRIGQKMQNLVRPKSWGSQQQGLVPYGEDDSSESDSDENYDDVAKRLSQQAPQSSGSGQPSTSVASTSTQSSPAKGKGKSDQGKGTLAESTDLTAIQSHDSPLKLTITTNGNAQRIKSTSTWHVNHSDSLKSPSLYSESSTGSVSSNSTQEWNVTDRPKHGSRKSRKDSGGSGKQHKPLTFPTFSKNGNADNQKSSDLEHRSSEQKSSVVRHITFSNHGEDETSENANHGKLGKNLSKLSISEDAIGKDAGDMTAKCSPRTEGYSSKDSDVSKVDSILNSQNSEQKSDSEVRKGGFVSNPERTIPFSPATNGDMHEHGINEASGKENEANIDHDRDQGVSRISNLSGEHRTLGIKERLSQKIRNHRNRKRRRRDSGEEKEGLLSKQDEGDKEVVAEDREWYVVGNQEDREERERSKKKKKKRKKKPREEEEKKGSNGSGNYQNHGSEKGIAQEREQLHKNTQDMLEVPLRTESKRDVGEKHKRFNDKENGSQSDKQFVDNDNSGHPHQRKSIDDVGGYKNDSHSDGDRHSRKKFKSSSSESEESRSHRKEKRRHESNSSEASSSDRTREKNHHQLKVRKRKHQGREEERKGLHEDYEEGEVRSPERKEYYVNGDRGSYHSGEGDMSHHKHKREAHEQSWDHHIRDGHKKPYHSKSRGSWDGRWSGSNDVVGHLSNTSGSGYGSLVQSWDGGRSLVDEDAERDARHAKRRDSYDEEFDQGRVKKVKRRPFEEDRNGHRGHHRNLFQYVQNNRNKGRSPFWRNRFGNNGYQRFGHKSSHSWRGSNWR